MLSKAQISELERIEHEASLARLSLDSLAREAARVLDVPHGNVWISDMISGGCDLVRMLEAMGRGGQLTNAARATPGDGK